MTPHETKRALGKLKLDYPEWHFWPGMAGLVYASRMMTSPPLVKRSPTVGGLRDQLEAEMRYRGHRWGLARPLDIPRRA